VIQPQGVGVAMVVNVFGLRSLVPATLLGLALAGCGGSAGSGSPAPSSAGAPVAAATIKVVPDPAAIGAFTPPSVTVKAGEAVEWDFQDLNPHTASSATFSSQPLTRGKKYSHTFATAGIYAFHCAIHPEMTGTITVN
jgi:plastocyanin